MIIQCPDCGFSGRIPDSALGTSHLATCPHCRFHFSLHVASSATAAVPPRVSSTSVEREAFRGDPGSSSYELKAISEDSIADDQAGDTLALRSGLSERRLALPTPIDQKPMPSGLAEGPEPVVAISSLAATEPIVGLEVPDPWYAPVLEVWGIVLLIWAAVVLGRDLSGLSPSAERSQGSGQVISTVISVLLLVAGAAGLFVAVDFGRSLRTGHKSPTFRRSRSKLILSIAQAIGGRVRRSWPRPPSSPEPIRP
jgi:hypothetical protein